MVPGSVLSVPCPGNICRHFGIVSDRPGYVIHNSRKVGRVIEEPIPDFADGKRVRWIGYPGRLTPDQVLARARARMGRPWHLSAHNCEHFIGHSHGTGHRSEQARGVFAVGLGIAIAIGMLG